MANPALRHSPAPAAEPLVTRPLDLGQGAATEPRVVEPRCRRGIGFYVRLPLTSGEVGLPSRSKYL
jgi:hypothetical protein